jgi:hypothetical protein
MELAGSREQNREGKKLIVRGVLIPTLDMA